MTKSLASIINARMHDGPCPSDGCLGECPAIWLVRTTDAGDLICGAAVYLWSAAKGLTMAAVAEWFESAGCSDVVVSQVMHDPDNATAEGVCEDGAIPLTVSFLLDSEQAAAFGLSAPTEAPRVIDDHQVDQHLNAILRASGSALRHYTMSKTLADMRQAVRDAMVAGVQAHEVQQAPKGGS